ncbi:Hypothetical protein D9617_10g074830 [Elsinoe fawcettii]|nr:Hypothetical protein D9617_10g074830 [Elsinoe fawcettii]
MAGVLQYDLQRHLLVYMNSQQRKFEKKVPDYVGNRYVEAWPDSGSSINTMNHDFAVSQGFHVSPIQDGDCKPIHNLIGAPVVPIGMVQTKWAFRGEAHANHEALFFTFRHGPDVLLGDTFLDLSSTIMHRPRRLMDVQITTGMGYPGSVLRAFLMRSPETDYLSYFDGYLDGTKTKALADSGCDPNILSLEYARSRGFEIDYSQTAAMELAGGMIERAVGTVYAHWRFEDERAARSHKRRLLAFHVLSGSVYDVVFGKDLVFGEGTHRLRTTRPSLGGDIDSSDQFSSHSYNQLREPLWQMFKDRMYNLFRWRGRRQNGSTSGQTTQGDTDLDNAELERRINAGHDIDSMLHGPIKDDAQRKERALQDDRDARARASIAVRNSSSHRPLTSSPSISNPSLSNPNSSTGTTRP